MVSAAQKPKHPHVVTLRAAGGNTAVISGSRFPVRSVVNYVLRQGLSPEELVREFRHLTLAQVYDALSYYYDHQEELERELAENTESSQRRDALG
jgi:uncharacterized protein (DUF433 family)